MSQDYKQIIQREYLNCVKSPAHFMKKYCKIQHPTKGKIKFNLYDYQQEMLTDFVDNRYNIILKSRQLGISTLSAGYSLWMMLFNPDKNILVIAKDKDTAKNLVTKVRIMYSNLPGWLKTKVVEDNKNGISIEDCEKVSKHVVKVLDVENDFSNKYLLEVSSPGLERKFFFEDQYSSYINCDIKVRYSNDSNKKISIKGELSEVTQEGLIIGCGDEYEKVPFSSIIQANLIM